MTMQELEGKRIKISAGTITVKDEYGKTRGMVRNIRALKRMNGRERFDLWQLMKKAEIGLDANINIILAGGKFYFLNNTRPLRAFETLEKKLGDCELVRDERRRYATLHATAEQAARHMTVINCEIL